MEQATPSDEEAAPKKAPTQTLAQRMMSVLGRTRAPGQRKFGKIQFSVKKKGGGRQGKTNKAVRMSMDTASATTSARQTRAARRAKTTATDIVEGGYFVISSGRL